MKFYGGYRALIVLATVLAHMIGTFAVRDTSNQAAKKRNGESSSVLWFSLCLLLSLLTHVLLFRRVQSLPPSSRSRAARYTSFVLLLLLLRAVESIMYLDPFFTLYFFLGTTFIFIFLSVLFFSILFFSLSRYTNLLF